MASTAAGPSSSITGKGVIGESFSSVTMESIQHLIEFKVDDVKRELLLSSPQLERITSHLSHLLWRRTMFNAKKGEREKVQFVHSILQGLLEIGCSTFSSPSEGLKIESELHLKSSVASGFIDLAVVDHNKKIKLIVEVKDHIGEGTPNDADTAQIFSELIASIKHNMKTDRHATKRSKILALLSDGEKYYCYVGKYKHKKFIITQIKCGGTLFHSTTSPGTDMIVASRFTFDVIDLIIAHACPEIDGSFDIDVALKKSRGKMRKFSSQFTECSVRAAALNSASENNTLLPRMNDILQGIVRMQQDMHERMLRNDRVQQDILRTIKLCFGQSNERNNEGSYQGSTKVQKLR
jgi:hypothetical protein